MEIYEQGRCTWALRTDNINLDKLIEEYNNCA
jgi:hypothetical protein